jgi:lipoprotein-anchoring transpeptidase ErfK/SrfK
MKAPAPAAVALLSTLLLAMPAAAKPAAKSGSAVSPVSIAVSLQKKILVVRYNGKDVKTFDVAVGTSKHPTPAGQFTIRHIVWNPAWVPPPDAKWAKGKHPTQPTDPKNPMKVVKLFFQEPDYYIHGTDQEDTIGAAASHGCIRMAQDDIYNLARYVQQYSGAPRDEAWYAAAINTTKPADVRLPQGVPLVIGK